MSTYVNEIYKIRSQMGAPGNKKRRTKINSMKPADNSKLFHLKIL